MVALIDATQRELQQKCLAAVDAIPAPLLTTWPCLTEAMYLISGLRGWHGCMTLWRYFEKGAISLHHPPDDEWQRLRELMEQYRDTPMDFADASLVSVAELRGARRILTLDADFYVYRIHGRESFEVITL